jgi:hypothetical protein
MNLLLALKSEGLLPSEIMNRPGRFMISENPTEGCTIHCKNRAQTAPRGGAKSVWTAPHPLQIYVDVLREGRFKIAYIGKWIPRSDIPWGTKRRDEHEALYGSGIALGGCPCIGVHDGLYHAPEKSLQGGGHPAK